MGRGGERGGCWGLGGGRERGGGMIWLNTFKTYKLFAWECLNCPALALICHSMCEIRILWAHTGRSSRIAVR